MHHDDTGDDYMSNMDLPPSSSEDEGSEEAGDEADDNADAFAECSHQQQHAATINQPRPSGVAQIDGEQATSKHSTDAQYGDVDVTPVVDTQEADKEASGEDLALMNTLQQAHAAQDMHRSASNEAEPNPNAKPSLVDVSVARSANVLQKLDLR